MKPSQVIVAVQSWPIDVYLRYLEDKGAWRYAGFEAAHKKNHPGGYRITRFDGHPFLRISLQGAGGSAVDSDYESWYDLASPDLKPVFGVTTIGQDFFPQFPLGRRVETIAEAQSPNEIRILSVVTLHRPDGTDLVSRRFEATYGRSPGSGPFKFQRAFLGESDPPVSISRQDYELLTGIDAFHGPTHEQLVALALPALTPIASGSDQGSKAWLRSLLSTCKETPEKRSLLSILEASR
jgi:hypothetical protein